MIKISTGVAAVVGAWLSIASGAGLSGPGIGGVAAEREFTMRGWTVEDGLPQSTPLAIKQTGDGYLWVGTYSGLARFDGVRFTSFTSANTPELVSDAINVLYEDRARNLWIGTEGGGLVCYREGEFHAEKIGSDEGSLRVGFIAEDSRGDLWLGTKRGLYRRTKNGWNLVEIPNVPANTPVRGLYYSRDDQLWVGTPNAVLVFKNGVMSKSIRVRKPLAKMGGDSDGTLWLSWESKGGATVDMESASLSSGDLDFSPGAFHPSASGTFYMGSGAGVVMRATGPGTTNVVRIMQVGDRSVTCLFEDRQGNLWVGVESSGLLRLKEKSATMLGMEHGLESVAITSLFQDQQGTIWAGTFGKGAHRWTGNNFEKAPIARSVFNVTTIAETSAGRLWMGTYGGNAFYEKGPGDFRIEAKMGVGFRAFCSDKNGGLWWATIGGGCAYFKDGTTTRYTTREGLANNQAMDIALDGQGNVWVATINGLSRFQGGKFESYWQKDGLGGNDIRALFVDSRGILWIGTSAGGLSRYESGRFTTLRVEHGLISDRIGQLLEDDEENLWMGTLSGIMKVSLRELDEVATGRAGSVHPVSFGREEGLIGTECGSGFQPSCLKTDSGQLWFATSGGIVVIDPKQLSPSAGPPEVHIEKTLVDGKQIVGGDVIIPAGARRVEFHYTGVDLSTPAMVRFRYRLEGYENDWVEAGNRREAIYTRVPPGRYRFLAMAATSAGAWSPVPASVGIEAIPFFWQTKTFQVAWILSAICGGALLVWVIQNQRHRRRLLELRRTHALEVERTRIAQDMHDGLGASLVKISLLGERVESRMAEPEQLQANIRKITATARRVMTEMDEIVWAVNPKNDTLESFAGYLCQFAREHFNDTEVQCRVKVPGQLPATPLGSEARHNLLLAVREALNNSLKHSQGKQVSVALEYTHPQITIEIQDDGVGMQPRAQREGNGLGNIRRRMEGLGGEVKIETSAAGTCVRLTLRVDWNDHKHMFM